MRSQLAFFLAVVSVLATSLGTVGVLKVAGGFRSRQLYAFGMLLGVPVLLHFLPFSLGWGSSMTFAIDLIYYEIPIGGVDAIRFFLHTLLAGPICFLLVGAVLWRLPDTVFGLDRYSLRVLVIAGIIPALNIHLCFLIIALVWLWRV
jgi:hypothetical protein